ncbi:MAG: biotin--[acetyl-CoA-carboxylase] ligase [Putridiphycobacter sp.]
MNLKHLTFNKVFLDEIDSTNSFLYALSKSSNLAEGTVVVTDKQLGGKGQRGNKWESEPGQNLTFSVLLKPKLSANKSFYLTIVSALSIQKVLKDLQLDAQIKWPNDILVKQQKICGILVENNIQGQLINQSIVGVGLNVNQIQFTNNIKATSIWLKGVEVNKEDLLKQAIQYFDFYYDHLLNSNFALLLKLYYQHMFWFQKEGQFFSQDLGNFNAVVVGVDDHGKLKLKTDRGIKKFDLKEVKFLY